LKDYGITMIEEKRKSLIEEKRRGEIRDDCI
jgi:hypothetical protein